VVEMRVDAAAGAAYVALTNAEVARTEQFSSSVLIDLDGDDRLRGIELLDLTATVDIDGIANRYGLPAVVRDELRRILIGESA